MKTKLLSKILFLMSVPVLYFIIFSGFNKKENIMNNAVSISQDTAAKSFTNLIFTDTYFGRFTPNDPRAIENNLINFTDSLHFNAMHVYGYGNLGGGFFEPISNYSSYITGLMNQVNSAGLIGYYGRSKIERLCYGQRLEYEAEGGNSGFSYQRRTASAIQDSGRTVLHACLPGQSNCPEADATPRYLCDSIYENLQHGDLIDFTQEDTVRWYIKPVMRIDTATPDDKKVVRIDVVNYSGQVINQIMIRAYNFKSSGTYNGNYTNNYFFDENRDSLEISGSRELPTGLSYGMRDAKWYRWKDSCKVDFKIWWYGEVEVWFDKLIVDDIWGNALFHKDAETRLRNEERIKEEAAEFTDNIGETGAFYIDEITYSQIPCIQRVYQLMKDTSANARLHHAVTNWFNIKGMKDNSIGHREILEQLDPVSFSADAHEMLKLFAF